jgi:hypothetical protein
MVWIVEKKVFHHVLDIGFERVRIPIRVKFEFEVKEGFLVPDSMSIHTLYNKQALQKHYPKLKSESLERSIDKKVQQEIHKYLKEYGFLKTEEKQQD